jgi:hypothetical protein
MLNIKSTTAKQFSFFRSIYRTKKIQKKDSPSTIRVAFKQCPSCPFKTKRLDLHKCKNQI